MKIKLEDSKGSNVKNVSRHYEGFDDYGQPITVRFQQVGDTVFIDNVTHDDDGELIVEFRVSE